MGVVGIVASLLFFWFHETNLFIRYLGRTSARQYYLTIYNGLVTGNYCNYAIIRAV